MGGSGTGRCCPFYFLFYLFIRKVPFARFDVILYLFFFKLFKNKCRVQLFFSKVAFNPVGPKTVGVVPTVPQFATVTPARGPMAAPGRRRTSPHKIIIFWMNSDVEKLYRKIAVFLQVCSSNFLHLKPS